MLNWHFRLVVESLCSGRWGELVEKNQALALPDQSEYQARYEQAKANLEIFIKNYKIGLRQEKTHGMRGWD